MEELRHDGRHAPEVPGPPAPAERRRQVRHLDGRLEPFRVHGARARREHDVDARRRAPPLIVFERARVPFEVVPPVELDGVHEDRDDDALRAPARLGDERHVPGVECPHRRDERDAEPGGPGRIRPRLHGARLDDGLHHPALAARAPKACASVGKSPPFTSSTYALAARTTSRPSSA